MSQRGDRFQSASRVLGLYQGLADAGGVDGLSKDFAPDFFDLIVVDECHAAARATTRAGARSSSASTRPCRWA